MTSAWKSRAKRPTAEARAAGSCVNDERSSVPRCGKGLPRRASQADQPVGDPLPLERPARASAIRSAPPSWSEVMTCTTRNCGSMSTSSGANRTTRHRSSRTNWWMACAVQPAGQRARQASRRLPIHVEAGRGRWRGGTMGFRNPVTDRDQGFAGGTRRWGGNRSGPTGPGPRGDEPGRPVHSREGRGEVLAGVLGRNARGGQRTQRARHPGAASRIPHDQAAE